MPHLLKKQICNQRAPTPRYSVSRHLTSSVFKLRSLCRLIVCGNYHRVFRHHIPETREGDMFEVLGRVAV